MWSINYEEEERINEITNFLMLRVYENVIGHNWIKANIGYQFFGLQTIFNKVNNKMNILTIDKDYFNRIISIQKILMDKNHNYE